MSKTLLVAACQKSSTRWTANRSGCVPVGKADAARGKFIKMRRLDIFRSLKTEILESEVVRQNQKDIRTFRLFVST